jgi:hypothetical protein
LTSEIFNTLTVCEFDRSELEDVISFGLKSSTSACGWLIFWQPKPVYIGGTFHSVAADRRFTLSVTSVFRNRIDSGGVARLDNVAPAFLAHWRPLGS